MGVRDSKQLSPAARERLYKKIINFVDDYYVSKIPPKTIDTSVSKNQLNHLEARYMAKVISKLRPDSSYVDSCDVNPRRFGREISRLAQNPYRECHEGNLRAVDKAARNLGRRNEGRPRT